MFNSALNFILKNNMKRKILFVIPTLHGGGAERVISSLFLNLNYKKYDLDLLVFDGSKKKNI